MAKKVELKPIRYPLSYAKPTYEQLLEVFKKYLLDPLNDLLEEPMTNAADDDSAVIKALKSGQIKYSKCQIYGKYSAKISKELRALGATFKHGRWVISPKNLPSDLSSFLEKERAKVERLAKKFDEVLVKQYPFLKDAIDVMPITKIGWAVSDKTSDEFKAKVREALAINPTISEESRRRIEQDYLKTEQLPIKVSLSNTYDKRVKSYAKDFSTEIVDKMRSKLHEQILGGALQKELQATVAKDLGLESKRRIQFIAQQETQLLMSNVHKNQAIQAGSKSYKWVTQGDGLVRETHKHLNGTIQDWDNPPIVDEKTGRRAHPRQDYRCRCSHRTILEF